jgi:quercetin dioxygenase-like cupin family protein
MYVIGLDEVQKTIPAIEGAKGVHKQIPLSRKDGAPAFSFRVFTIEPGGHTPYHRHKFEHMNYVISGQGILVAEDREHALKQGDFALVLAGEKHQYRNSSDEQVLIIICAVPREYE